MLTPRLTNCPECADIPNLLKRIDCKLAEYANGLYNNVVFMLNQVVPARAMIQLLAYKRILTYKQCNNDYLADFCIDKIVSKVIRLTSGCYIKPIFTPTPTTSTTSTSTTCPPLNCSFDGTGVSSCSFTGTVHKVTIPPTTTSTTTAIPTTSTTSTTSSTSTSTTSSTSSTSTSTSTSTSSSTTTTTTTPSPGYYTYYFSVGRTSSFQACGETPPFDNTFYSDSITLDLGSVLYTNSTLVTPVGGGDQWFFLGSDFIAYQVDNSGVIIDFFNCV
jgi:hypothetical protein